MIFLFCTGGDRHCRTQFAVEEAPQQVHEGGGSFRPPPPSPSDAPHPASATTAGGLLTPAPAHPLRILPAHRPDLLTHGLAAGQPLQPAAAVWGTENDSHLAI